MKTIYLSFPITGRTDEEVHATANAIEQRFLQLSAEHGEDLRLINPLFLAEQVRKVYGEEQFNRLTEREQLAQYLAADIEAILSSADYVFFARGDMALKSCPSKGMRLEYQTAKIYGIPRFGVGWSEDCPRDFPRYFMTL